MSDQQATPQKKKKGKLGYFLLFIFLFAATTLTALWFLQTKHDSEYIENEVQAFDDKDSLSKTKKMSEAEFKKKNNVNDTNITYIMTSDTNGMSTPFMIDEKAGKIYKKLYTGARINIAITGVDSRVGESYRHADANHVMSILIDSGKIEMIAIPRDTYCDCGMPDSSGQNKLTVSRQALGRKGYLRELAKIAEVDQIHYYVEVGFSQALGVIEWLGYDNPTSTLQVLRSRKGLGGDDFQRSYNQSQFIRQAVLKHLEKLAGLSGEIVIPAGLSLVESNITPDIAKNIISGLKKKGFPKSPDDITVKVRPSVGNKFKVYDLTDDKVIAGLKTQIEKFNAKTLYHDSTYKDLSGYPQKRLTALVYQASLDSAKNPSRVIKNLQVVFDQKAWNQVPDKNTRYKLRDDIRNLLVSAYYKSKKPQEAQRVSYTIDLEKKAFENSMKKQ